jgi:type VI protein secretion system component Hcp
MSFDSDGRLDTDEALRMLELAQQGGGTLDMLMLIEARGTAIEGESPRAFADGKQRMEVLGYDVHAQLRVATGASAPSLLLSHLQVVRQSDAATASIASLLRNQTTDLKIRLSIFRAGGDSGADAQPKLEFEFEGARVAEIALLTGGKVGAPCEVIRFGYRVMKIHSAPQRNSGARGAVRTCELVA